jgi:3-dehydroquinate dehydratase
MRQTGNENVKHVIVTPPGKAGQLLEMLPMFDKTKVVALSEVAYQASLELIPATLAAVVYYQKNRSLSYLGPHSSGVICGKGKAKSKYLRFLCARRKKFISF